MGVMITGFSLAILLASGGEVAPLPLTANEHPWGNFPKKSWCIVHTATVSNIEGRAIQSSQTVKTVLESIDESGITLQETETLEIGGETVEKNPQATLYDFFQERIQENVKVSQGPLVKLVLDNKKVVPCAVRIYNQQTSGGDLTTTIWYTAHVYPYVLRVEKILRSSPSNNNTGGQIIRHSVTLVRETSALKKLRGSRKNRTYSKQTVEKAGNITKITDERCSWDVPGGLLESATREFDAQNREIRRSTSRMTN